MRPPQYTITRRTVHVYAEYVCQRYIRLKDHGPKCKASVLWAVLFWAAARISSLAAACAARNTSKVLGNGAADLWAISYTEKHDD